MDSKKNVAAVARCRAKRKRVEMLFKPGEYEKIKGAADESGETVSGYIKKAIAETVKTARFSE